MMSKAEPSSFLESSVPSEEKQETWVLLIDSDGTLFYGNMKTVISAVIRFLKKAPSERSTLDQLFTSLGDDLPEDTQNLLRPWLAQQEQIPWAKPAEELWELQQTIAGFFPLIHYQRDEETSFTALDVFKAIWEKQGIVMILTFNSYAPHTLRHALIQHGLPKEHAQQVYIIYPGDSAIPPKEGIFPCEPPGDGCAINKNGFIQKAQSICSEEFKLTHCHYIFVDDQHTQAAQLLKCSDMHIITGEYARGQHLGKTIGYIKGDIPLIETRTPERRHDDDQTSNHPSPESRMLHIEGEEGATPVLLSLRPISRRTSHSLSARTPVTLTKKLPRKMSTLELPPMLGATTASPSTDLSVNPSVVEDSLSPLPLVSPHRQKLNSGFSFFTSSTDEKLNREMAGDVTLTRRSLNKQLAFSSSSEIFEVDTHRTAILWEQKQTSHHRIDSARPGRLHLDLNPGSSQLELDSPKNTEGTDETPLILPPLLAPTFEAAYAHAVTLSQKIKAIIQAIEYFYPQTTHTLESAAVRFTATNPRRELHLWIQKLDTLFFDHAQNPAAQQELVVAAQACWIALQPLSLRETAATKNSPLSTDTTEEDIHFFSSRTGEIATHVAVKELEKWHQRQLALSKPVGASSCCCLIL